MVSLPHCGEGASGARRVRVLPVIMAESRAQQVAVVTGASSGIGLHTALGLARAGMRVVLLGRDRTRTKRHAGS
jgi:hypothetical protein